MPTYVTGEGITFTVLEKSRPVAEKDFECCWYSPKPHVIKKGERYVRVVYKVKGESRFESDHICLDCWCGVPENGE